MMQQLMQNPMMEQMMASLMDDPVLMREMLGANPAMRALLERQPELSHVLADPSVLRQAMELARNPTLLREQVRNTDRALSNLDTSPEAYSALRRMYTDIQSPMMDAAMAPPPASSAAGGGGGAANPFASLFAAAPPAAASAPGGLNAQPLPNPWAPAQPTPPSPLPAALGGFPAGLGGMGLGGAEGAGMEALLASPAMGSALEAMAANPALMDSLVAAHPGMQAMLQAQPGLRAMLSNPAALRAMADPANLRAMAQMQAAMAQLQASGLAPGGPGALPGMGMGMGALGMGLPGLPSPFGLGMPGLGGMAPTASAVPPATLYATQLTQMRDMGFADAEANVRALQATGGNVHAAVERLLTQS